MTPDDEAGNGFNKRPERPEDHEYDRLEQGAEELRKLVPDKRAGTSKLQSSNAYLRYTGIGIQFVAIGLLPAGLGYWLDTVFETLPWLLLTGLLLGFVAAMVFVILEVSRLERSAKK